MKSLSGPSSVRNISIFIWNCGSLSGANGLIVNAVMFWKCHNGAIILIKDALPLSGFILEKPDHWHTLVKQCMKIMYVYQGCRHDLQMRTRKQQFSGTVQFVLQHKVEPTTLDLHENRCTSFKCLMFTLPWRKNSRWQVNKRDDNHTKCHHCAIVLMFSWCKVLTCGTRWFVRQKHLKALTGNCLEKGRANI